MLLQSAGSVFPRQSRALTAQQAETTETPPSLRVVAVFTCRCALTCYIPFVKSACPCPKVGRYHQSDVDREPIGEPVPETEVLNPIIRENADAVAREFVSSVLVC